MKTRAMKEEGINWSDEQHTIPYEKNEKLTLE